MPFPPETPSAQSSPATTLPLTLIRTPTTCISHLPSRLAHPTHRLLRLLIPIFKSRFPIPDRPADARRRGTLQNLAECGRAFEERVSVMDCGCALPLWNELPSAPA